MNKTTNEEEPMHLGRSRLSPEVREFHFQERLCLYCGGKGHLIRTDIPSPSLITNSLFPVSLAWGLENPTVGVLLDSGADECLIDATLTRQAGIPLETLETTVSAQALDGHLLGKISHRTVSVTLTISGNHVDNVQFFVLHTPAAPLVLGRPWLNLHDPHVSWSTGRILGLSHHLSQFHSISVLRYSTHALPS